MKEMFMLNPRRRKHRRRTHARRARRMKRHHVVYTANPKRRRHRRRSGRRSALGGSLTSSIRSLTSREVLMIGGGIALATIGTKYVLQNYGAKLPLMDKPTLSPLLYGIGIPVIAAYLLRRASPQLARGLLYGGVASGALTLYGKFAKQGVASASAYLNRPYVPGLSRLPGPRNHSAVDTFSGAIVPSRAFRHNAWAPV